MANPDLLSPAIFDPGSIEPEPPRVSRGREVFPPTRGTATPLVDGEAAFQEMYRRILEARHSIEIAIWYIQLETILKGPRGTQPQLLTKLLQQKAQAGVKIRILVSYLECKHLKIGGKSVPFGFCKALPAKKVCQELNKLHPNVEAHPAVHPYYRTVDGQEVHLGCSHEKTVLVDGKIAFCGGLEFTKLYTSANPSHRSSSRHDVHALLEGPVVDHFAQHFAQRWQRVTGAPPDRPQVAGYGADVKKIDHAVQVAITRSVDGPLNYQTVAKGIFELYRKAVEQANDLIYIENQYFRDVAFTDCLLKRLKEKPNLAVILVLPEKAEEDSNAMTLHAEYIQRTLIERLRSSPRAGVFSLRRKSGKGGDIYVHAKLMIVDDRWLTIGSANANARSFNLDDEINFAVRDDTLARKVRQALWSEHFQISNEALAKIEANPKMDPLVFWQRQAQINDRRLKGDQAPVGRAIPHVPPPGKKLDFDKLDLSLLQRLFLPEVDMFVGDFPRQPTDTALT